MAPRSGRGRAVVWSAIGIAALAFAIEGGEYGTRDLVRQWRADRRLTSDIDSVKHVVDSLETYRTRLQKDVKLQERIAREVFGMVRDRELQYRFYTPGDSGKK